MSLWLRAALLLSAAAAGKNPLLGRRAPPQLVGKDPCGGSCCGMAHYPVAVNGTARSRFYAEFDVPALPQKMDGICYYIYFNIFFGSSKPNGIMNQFPSQLILGDSLDGSSGPPLYKPLWHFHATWSFGAHYFFEIFNVTSNKTEAHAAYGDLHPTKEGEVLWTAYELDSAFVWHLSMGVKGDPSRTSVLQVPQPYMGLLPDEAKSWAEPAFDHCFANSCWELYGMRDREHYPTTGSRNHMQIMQPKPGSYNWYTNWTEIEQPHCNGAGPVSSIVETHNATHQEVYWDLFFDPYPPPPLFPPSHASAEVVV